MRYLVDSTSFNEAWFQLELLIIETCLVVFLYGIYVHFFISGIRNLSCRNNSGRLPLLTATWVMLVFGTARLVLQIGQLVISARLLQKVVTDPIGSKKLVGSLETLVFVETVVSVVNNFFTDLVLLFRCYTIWGFRKKIVAGPAVLVLATLIVSMSLVIKSQSSVLPGIMIFICAAITNLVLAALTAGRLWSTQRKTTSLGDDFPRRITRALEIVVESAAIYCITATILAVTVGSGNRSEVIIYQITGAISSQIVNLVPTLALVRGTRETDRIRSSGNGLVSRDLERAGIRSGLVASRESETMKEVDS
ncbi:hypothetical protein FB45DRAFT_1058315 [Roridomyces roridus]|uniref:Uncharacterized protein n=1 Tax=Roridomyces roridus TaxID=1738132 RepID=A0AAD7BTE4_9AGAR|nr:hypothetical protein FB45DRAFT_1058315 [Roridomyces roridus]